MRCPAPPERFGVSGKRRKDSFYRRLKAAPRGGADLAEKFLIKLDETLPDRIFLRSVSRDEAQVREPVERLSLVRLSWPTGVGDSGSEARLQCEERA